MKTPVASEGGLDSDVDHLLMCSRGFYQRELPYYFDRLCNTEKKVLISLIMKPSGNSIEMDDEEHKARVSEVFVDQKGELDNYPEGLLDEWNSLLTQLIWNMEIFFNELSVTYPCDSIHDAQLRMSGIIKLLSRTQKEGSNICRIFPDYITISLAPDYSILNRLQDTSVRKVEKQFF